MSWRVCQTSPCHAGLNCSHRTGRPRRKLSRPRDRSPRRMPAMLWCCPGNSRLCDLQHIRRADAAKAAQKLSLPSQPQKERAPLGDRHTLAQGPSRLSGPRCVGLIHSSGVRPTASIPATPAITSLSDVSPVTPTAPTISPRLSRTRIPPGTGTTFPPWTPFMAAMK